MCIKSFIDRHVAGKFRKKFSDSHGQALTLFGLLIPLLFMFVCAGLDLGWYYMNVSRLQNAADAAALAGAQELVEANEKFSAVQGIFLVKNYLGTADSTDISAGNAVVKIYADKNLSGGNGGSVTNSWTNGTVTDIETLYKDDDGNFYYVVYLVENIRHFLMPGWFHDMGAPVVAIAMLSQYATDIPVVIGTSRTLLLDANGGELTDDDGESGTRRTVKENTETDTPWPTKATINLKNYDSTFNEELLFIGWNTKPDGSGTTYADGKSFTQSELNQLFGTGDTVVLYAQWERRNIYIAGDSLYNAMKGNASYETKGLEELMTYNTWVAINKLGKDGTYGVYPDGGGSVYNSKGDHFRIETTNINSSVTSSKSTNFNIFLDLGSDLMYNNNANSSGYGLFKYTWDIADILNYNSTLASIVAKKNSFVSSNPSLTYNFTNNVSSISKADAIKYRVHTRFNLDAAWTVRSKYYNNESYTSSKYVSYVRECLNTVLTALKSKYGTNKKISAISTLADDVDEIIAGKVGIPIQYSPYLTNIISSNASKTLSNTNISSIVNNFNPATMIPSTDPLYVRIESEELNEADGDRQNTTVRQMFINVNKANTGSSDRPLIIFYEGPDRGLTEGVDDSDKNSSQSGSPKEAYPDLSWRDSKPVILNLNADFRGILFAPNSPVVINGNGKNFYGFVIAREFVRVTTEKDYTVKDGKYIDANGKEWFKSSQTNNGITNTVFVDEYGNVDTRPLDNATRKLGSAETLAGIPAEDEIVAYRARHLDMELVYKMSAFNLGSSSYYDSFNVPELKRNVYTYLDNYQDSSKANSVDMFFTTIRSKWVT